jgi:hypothetical protein
MKRSIDRITFSRERLTHADVAAIRTDVCNKPSGRVVVLDLRQTSETTTAALAALILLRRERIAVDGDLLILGLTGKAQYLYEILRLAKVLPRRPCISPRRHRQRRDGRDAMQPSKRSLPVDRQPAEHAEAMA